MWDTDNSRERLHVAWQRLEARWIEVRQSWKGVTSRHFANHGWAEWEAEKREYQRALEDLRDALETVNKLYGP